MSFFNLAIETSGRNNGVALSVDGKIVSKTDANSFLKDRARHATGISGVLMPMIQSVLQAAGVAPGQLGLISVTRGPGMFTGLRVGVVTAKTLAFSIDCPLVAIDTLKACAIRSAVQHQLKPGQVVSAVINAQRGQLFAANFQVGDDLSSGTGCQSVDDAQVLDPGPWIARLTGDEFLTGPGLKLAQNELTSIRNRLPGLQLEDEDKRACDVATVAAIGEHKFRNGQLESPWELKPVYFRPSAAEEVRLEKGDGPG